MPENVNTSILHNLSEENTSDTRETIIKVEHVSMIFNMASEQLNSLKEYAIQIARRKLFFEKFTALDDISFEVKKGDVFGIIGTNGSGKSTLLKIIAGVLEPSKGSCHINGNIAPLIELGAGFDSELSARENIYLNGALLGYSKNFIKEHFDEIVDFAEIEEFLDMPLKNYSSGMVARIAFAIATVIVPEILVVDEVLSVGDFMFQKKCEDRINELIERYGVTVLIVSHSNDQIERLCNKAIWIEKGHTRMLDNASSVCRVYNGLGGRTGSAKSEQYIFNALHTAPVRKASEFSIIAGDNSCEISVNFASRGWNNTNFNTAVIVSGTTHINAIIANALAGAYNAPIFVTKPDGLSDNVELILHKIKPSTIYFIDCSNHAIASLDAIKNFSWRPSVIEFLNEESISDLSLDVYRYGRLKNLWGDTIILLSFDDNPESLAAAPLSYEALYPVLVMSDKTSFNTLKDVLHVEDKLNILVVGSSAANITADFFQSQDFSVKVIAGASTQQTCLCLCDMTLTYMKKKYKYAEELCVASLSLAQWPELLSSGGYVSKRHGALLLEDTTDLDHIASCLDFVSENSSQVSQLTFIGKENALSHLDRELLFNAFLSKSNSH